MKFPGTFGLYTDYYELLMAQGYFLAGRQSEPAVFDYFFRNNPFDSGYTVFAGLHDLLPALQALRFGSDDLDYLRSLGFRDEFRRYLADFRFRGTIRACRVGEFVFPLEPMVRVEGGLVETQLIETLLLNVLNFESLVATKAARIRQAAGSRTVAEFGLRRAQGPGGIQASRAAIIGGLDSTSNVFAARAYDLAPSGTQAHSWIQSFDDELAAFRAFADLDPDPCVLLVDTYDTLGSGVPNAITVAREMAARGRRLAGVRLDSGDLAYLSRRARQMLDNAGLPEVKIVASNRLDEHVIRSLLDQGAPIDVFGVGTALATGAPDAALDGVYKLCLSGGRPRLKFSENPEKMSLPGRKRPVRAVDGHGLWVADAIALDDEERAGVIHHPAHVEVRSNLDDCGQQELHELVMKDGEPCGPVPAVGEIAAYVRRRLLQLPPEHRRFEHPHLYRVGITARLLALRTELAEAGRPRPG